MAGEVAREETNPLPPSPGHQMGTHLCVRISSENRCRGQEEVCALGVQGEG